MSTEPETAAAEAVPAPSPGLPAAAEGQLPGPAPDEGQPAGNEPAAGPGTCIGCSHPPHCLQCTRPASREPMHDAGGGYLYCLDAAGCEQRWAEIVKAIRKADMARAAAAAQS